MNLSFLFASFGHQLHQVFISYGLLLGVSCAAVRETSSMMVGQYFKLRRNLAEMWSLSGIGIGILIFSLLYFQAIGSVELSFKREGFMSIMILMSTLINDPGPVPSSKHSKLNQTFKRLVPYILWRAESWPISSDCQLLPASIHKSNWGNLFPRSTPHFE